MRFRKNHVLLRSIIDEFKLRTRPFDIPPPKLFLRGRHLTLHDVRTGQCDFCGAGIPFHLHETERGKSAEDLVRDVIHQVLKGLSFPNLHQTEVWRLRKKLMTGEFSPNVWLAVQEFGYYGNSPLYAVGFWNLLQHFLSNEAFQMVHDILSLESVLGNWSAAEAIPWFLSDFSNQELSMLPGGMQAVTTHLVERLRASNIERSKETIASEVTWNNSTWNVQTLRRGEASYRTYDHVILAVPPASLSKIEIKDNKGTKWSPSWLGQVRPRRLFKLFLLFEREWWIGDDAPGSAKGRVFTDLPLRQIYYFSPEWMKKCADIAQDDPVLGEGDNRRFRAPWSLVMASYSDEHYVDYWSPGRSGEVLRDQHMPYFRYPALDSQESVDDFLAEVGKIPKSLRTSERVTQKVVRLLRQIHRVEVPDPILGVSMDWGQEPHGGGWHTWEVGSKPWEWFDLMIKDQEQVPGLYLCGEAYSTEQGWIEGALRSVEAVLHALELAPPPPQSIGDIADWPTYIGIKTHYQYCAHDDREQKEADRPDPEEVPPIAPEIAEQDGSISGLEPAASNGDGNKPESP